MANRQLKGKKGSWSVTWVVSVRQVTCPRSGDRKVAGHENLEAGGGSSRAGAQPCKEVPSAGAVGSRAQRKDPRELGIGPLKRGCRLGRDSDKAASRNVDKTRN